MQNNINGELNGVKRKRLKPSVRRAIRRMSEHAIAFGAGGTIYSLCEVCFRGYTHWTMTITGGVCLVGISEICRQIGKKRYFLKSLCGAILITELEFLVGCLVNIVFKMAVWDYSHMPMNILGQVCPTFFLLWFVLSIPAVAFCEKVIPRFRAMIY